MEFRYIVLISFVAILAIGAVSASQDNLTGDGLTVNEDINIESSFDEEIIAQDTDCEILEADNEKMSLENDNNNDLLEDAGEFIDVSDAYSYLNQFRTENGVWQWDKGDTTKTVFNTNDTNTLQPLARDLNLEATAEIRAKELAEKFSHTRPDGTMCYTAFPDGLMAQGENIAYGQTSCLEVTEAWKETNDPYSGQGHRRNMLENHFNCVGIAGYKVNGVIYWVQDFGYSNNIVSGEIKNQNANTNAKVEPKNTAITAKKAVFKAKKAKKYTITLKSGKNAVKKVAVYLKMGKKTFKATTNSQGKATFKIKLSKKGNYKATVTFKGNKSYAKTAKKVGIIIK